MRNRRCLWLFIVVAICLTVRGRAQEGAPGEQFVGTWSGTWEGSGTGGFELTLEKRADGALGGKVSITGEPTYDATLTSAVFEGAKMNAKYDFTPDTRAEVILAATFEGGGATGTWSLRDKASGNEIAAGTWTVKKK